MAKEINTIDFTRGEPQLIRSALLNRIRENFKRSPILHVFFTGAKIRIIRGNNYALVDKAYDKMPAKLIGVHNKNEQGQPLIEKTIINDAEQAIRQWYG